MAARFFARCTPSQLFFAAYFSYSGVRMGHSQGRLHAQVGNYFAERELHL